MYINFGKFTRSKLLTCDTPSSAFNENLEELPAMLRGLLTYLSLESLNFDA